MKRGKLCFASALAVLVSIAAPAVAQHQHEHPPAAPQQPAPQPSEPPAPAAPQEPAEHEMQGMQEHGMEEHGMHAMPGLLGPYGMSRESSGTAWQPDSAPHRGIHTRRGPWEAMLHGFASLVYDDQDGPRGDEKTFGQNMLMGMASRPLGTGRLGLRAMLSAEPWTIGSEGYPLLLQTGETADGVTPLVDRQHPHDFFMELSGSYSVPWGADGAAFLYLGLPGEPALGPPAFMHRWSGQENPEAPLGHHWLDSTHITHGVATLGWIRGNVKLEGSLFTGREPDQNREGIESPKMDSWSLRASWNPTPDWSLQVSRGHLNSPEQLAPELDTDRTTASATFNRPLNGGNWQTTFAWGRNAKDPGETTDAFLLESAASRGRHTLFGRVERQENDELLGHGEEGEIFNVGKVSLGYIYDFQRGESWKGGVGLLGSQALVPGELEETYGDSPVSWMAFLRVRL
jgi:hypothetical protein